MRGEAVRRRPAVTKSRGNTSEIVAFDDRKYHAFVSRGRPKRWAINNVWRAIRTRGKTSRVIRAARVYTHGSRSVLATILQLRAYINIYGAQYIRVVDVTTGGRIERGNVMGEEKGYRRSIHFLCTSRLFHHLNGGARAEAIRVDGFVTLLLNDQLKYFEIRTY